MAFDFKKEYREYYLPKQQPQIVSVPPADYIAVCGQGDPNAEGGAYQKAIGVLYAVAYTIKMSKKGDHRISGYFDFVVPPLEGFWWQDGITGVDYSDKASFHWISVLRLPDFVTPADLNWAAETASVKKKTDCSGAEFLHLEEGTCVQIMHEGPFDSEPESVARMDAWAAQNGYETDLSDVRRHHEIYLTDARRTAPEKWRTVIRHPVRRKR
jgi:hypothetical protein